MSDYTYLDNAATTPVAPEAVEAILRHYTAGYGNPSSSHSLGVEAHKAVDSARQTLAGILNCGPAELVFTGGGSEANNLAIVGAAQRTRKRTIIVSAIEHPAVLETGRALEQQGFTLQIAPVDNHGLVEVDRLVELVDEDTFLVSIMAANNEIGTIQPVKRLARMVKKQNPDVLFHTDAVQFFAKQPLSLADGALDMVSMAAHKIHGPKGIGALYVKKGTKLSPIVHGGGQEGGFRSGTENVPGIVGFVTAAKLLVDHMSQDEERIADCMDRIRSVLEEKLDGILVNGHPDHRLPNVLSIGVRDIKSQNLLHFLEDEGVVVSAGSACHSTRTRRSHVIEAIGLPPEYATIRISASRYTDPDEAQDAAQRMVEVISRLRG
jgi:cysteine desulfurase